MNNELKPLVTQQYPDRFFRALFSEKKRAAELCNVLVGTNYAENDSVRLSRVTEYNEWIFETNNELVCVSEQSIPNDNMPMKMLACWAKYSMTIGDVYRRTSKIRMPKFFVLYSGDISWNVSTLKLSDAFTLQDAAFGLEAEVKVVNIKFEGDASELKNSHSLRGYSHDVVVKRAVDTCIEKGYIADFLEENYKQVLEILGH